MRTKLGLLVLVLLCSAACCYAQVPMLKTAYDTIRVYGEVVNGDTIPVVYLRQVDVWGKKRWLSKRKKDAYGHLKEDVELAYPYAKQAAIVLSDIHAHLDKMTSEKEKRRYIHLREKEITNSFKAAAEDMYTRQGRILIMLIDRQTGHTCYDVLKELKGDIRAWGYQTIAVIYDDDLNLKRPYNPMEHQDIEKIIYEIEHPPVGEVK